MNPGPALLISATALAGCATSYDRWQAVKTKRGLYAWGTCVERAGLAASESAGQQPVRAVDEQPSVVPRNWLLNASLRACDDIARAARTALTPAQIIQLERDAARAVESAIASERADQEAGIL